MFQEWFVLILLSCIDFVLNLCLISCLTLFWEYVLRFLVEFFVELVLNYVEFFSWIFDEFVLKLCSFSLVEPLLNLCWGCVVLNLSWVFWLKFSWIFVESVLICSIWIWVGLDWLCVVWGGMKSWESRNLGTQRFHTFSNLTYPTLPNLT